MALGRIDQFLIDVLNKKSVEVPEDFDWKVFARLIDQEGVTGLVYHHLRLLGLLSQVPEEVIQGIEQQYLTNYGRNMIMEEEVKEVVHALEEAKIDCIILRGGVFFNQLYQDLGIRPLVDMDILINGKNFAQVQEVLKQHGFEHHEEYPYFLFKQDLYIDMHLDSINFWRLDWPSALSIKNDAVWQRLASFKGKHHVRTFGLYDHILHCCEHWQRHGFERLIWLMDIVYLTKDNFHWGSLVQRARTLNLEKPLFYVVQYMRQYGLAKFSEDELKAVSQVRLNMIEERILQKLLSNDREAISGELTSFFALPTWRMRMKAVRKAVFVRPTNFPLVNKPLTVWIYLKRIFKLLFSNVSKSVALFRS